MPRAFITGVTGQDGRHLAELLHQKGYQAFGLLHGGIEEWKRYVRTDKQHFRPADVECLGDARKAKRILGWERTVSFEELVRTMVESDLELARAELEHSGR